MAFDPLSLPSANTGRTGREIGCIRKRLNFFHQNNNTCADCPEALPSWVSFVSLNAGDEAEKSECVLAVLTCLQCYSLHCRLSQTEGQLQPKNIKLVDEWTESEVEILERGGGNLKVNNILEAKLNFAVYNKNKVLEDAVADIAARQEFVKHKYQKLSYFDSDLLKILLQQNAAAAALQASQVNAPTGTGSHPNKLQRCSTYDSANKPEFAHLVANKKTLRRRTHSLKGLKEAALAANATTSASASEQEMESAMTYGLPTHLGIKHRSSNNLINGKAKNKGGRSRPPRGRRKSSGPMPGSEQPGGHGMTASSSTPCISRWGASSSRTNSSSPPHRSKKNRWTASTDAEAAAEATQPASPSSQKNFTWNSAARPPRPSTTNHQRNRFSESIASLHVPQRAASDESGDDSLRMPRRVVSDDSGDDSTRHGAASIMRMPRRVISDDSGEDSTRKGNRRSTIADGRSKSTLDPNNIHAAALLARRKSLPSLTALMSKPEDEDSIRNQYGVGIGLAIGIPVGQVNSSFPVRRQRTCLDATKASAGKPHRTKYGIKLKYGFDSCTDSSATDESGRAEKRTAKNNNIDTAASCLVRSNTAIAEQGSDSTARMQMAVPTLGLFLQANKELPNKILGGRSLGTASSDEDILGIGHGKTRGSTISKQQAASKLNKKGVLWNHLNTSGASKLQALTGLGMEQSFGVPQTASRSIRRGASCGGLKGLTSFGSSDESISVFSRSSRESVW